MLRLPLLIMSVDLRGGEPVDELLARFLKARGGDKTKALSMLKEDLEWREKNSVHLVRTYSSRDVLEVDKFPNGKQKHDEIFRHGFLGYDKQGRPIVYKWYFNLNHRSPCIAVTGNCDVILAVGTTRITSYRSWKAWMRRFSHGTTHGWSSVYPVTMFRIPRPPHGVTRRRDGSPYG